MDETLAVSQNGDKPNPTSKQQNPIPRHVLSREQLELGRKKGRAVYAAECLVVRFEALIKKLDEFTSRLSQDSLNSENLGAEVSWLLRVQEGFSVGGSLERGGSSSTSLQGEQKNKRIPSLSGRSSLHAPARARKERLEDPGPQEFQDFYAVYPWKTARKAALRAWRQLNPDQELQARIMLAIDQQCRVNFAGPDAPSPPHASAWLNGERWNDKIAPPRSFRKPTHAENILAWQRSVHERLKNGSQQAYDDNPDHWTPQHGVHRPPDGPGADGPVPLAPGWD